MNTEKKVLILRLILFSKLSSNIFVNESVRFFARRLRVRVVKKTYFCFYFYFFFYTITISKLKLIFGIKLQIDL